MRALLFLATLVVIHAQEWHHWGGDAGGQKYSKLKQVNRANVGSLKLSWEFKTGEIADGKNYVMRSAFETTPLVANGVMYLTTPFNRVVALEPETGKQLWSFDPGIDKTKAANLFISRGCSYWTDGKQERILHGTQAGRLYSLDAKTGLPDPAFGTGGSIDLRAGVADKFPDRGYGVTSPPVIFKNLVITGAWVSDGDPQGPSGDVRAFDILTGKLAWTFHTVPRPGEFGNDTWEGDSWKDRGGTNVWSVMSLDQKRGLVFLPLTSPSPDYYAAGRKGANLFGDSVVALNAATGQRVWHFQTIHHNIWDYDLPAQPALVTVKKDGKVIDAVAQVAKTGYTFLFDRATGVPIFPVEEMPVPPSGVPGESAWPTQPRPTKPPPFARQKMAPDELTQVTPESRAFCEAILKDAQLKPIFTPLGVQTTILFPGTNGGTNWGGASFDPESRTLYVNSMDVAMVFRQEKRPDGSLVPYRNRGVGTNSSRFWDPNLYPCQQPPWGHLTAIDLDKGEFRWRIPLGEYDELTKRGVPPTGTPNLGGSLVTAGGLVFIAATNDARFRAFDKDTGKRLWETRLPASGHANPMTFHSPKTGKQYIVVAAGGGNKYNTTFADSLMVYALP
ncbi:MAG: pyrroloquinoline quinone-dependent dehydrogenase [Bryobacterales bacterium]|nr:pyrroloquinoline quinone-dependent dehydrogenase [Bryobacterales bacterium]